MNLPTVAYAKPSFNLSFKPCFDFDKIFILYNYAKHGLKLRLKLGFAYATVGSTYQSLASTMFFINSRPNWCRPNSSVDQIGVDQIERSTKLGTSKLSRPNVDRPNRVRPNLVEPEFRYPFLKIIKFPAQCILKNVVALQPVAFFI